MRYVLTTLMFVISTTCYGGSVTQNGLRITKVLAGYDQGQIYFFLDNAPLNPQECIHSNSANVVVVDPDRSDVSQVLSILLLAKASDVPIDIQVYDDYCLGGYAAIRRVGV